MSLKILIWSSILVICILALTTFLYKNQDRSPQAAITAARNSITQALNSHSDKYSKRALNDAQAYYDSAMYHWKLQNEKWFFQRDYTKARAFAENASNLAVTGALKSETNAARLKTESKALIQHLQDQFSTFDQVFKNFQLTQNLKDKLLQANLLHDQGKSAFQRKDYNTSQSKLYSASLMINEVNSYCKIILNEYFENYEEWKNWSEKAIKESANTKSTCLIIDKFSRQCYIYKSGHLAYAYNVELGPNWIGDKKHQGDKRTPEGIYRVVSKKEQPETKYYKAILLNYPNEEDKARFRQNLKTGKIKASAKIGGLIEIHGNGGKGLDWTEGCVALPDDQMDVVYKACKPGTTVVILGSLIPLKDIID